MSQNKYPRHEGTKQKLKKRGLWHPGFSIVIPTGTPTITLPRNDKKFYSELFVAERQPRGLYPTTKYTAKPRVKNTLVVEVNWELDKQRKPYEITYTRTERPRNLPTLTRPKLWLPKRLIGYSERVYYELTEINQLFTTIRNKFND
jgi:hypothetical protein